ncbi:hypothetical protein [Stutzerimonas azotifigens]|uniref:hypothetical protein n=1 Tax=Stutzerimonas azotifigens TaxID=291995 RepID=UPI0003FFE775|nr:hypothetical protein [Stutzerimonas azotifigens]
MNAPLRFNEALLITDQAFQPFQCVAWTLPEGNGEVSITVIDRTHSRTLARRSLSRGTYTDPVKLGETLAETREELSREGVSLQPWHMPE